jgi:hypothetical protein
MDERLQNKKANLKPNGELRIFFEKWQTRVGNFLGAEENRFS